MTCKTCHDHGYLLTAPSTCSAGGERRECPVCRSVIAEAGEREAQGWDHRYRPLAWGEVILPADECRGDDGTWVTGICVGEKAPDPAYTSHRVYRRLISTPATLDNTAVEEPLGPLWRKVQQVHADAMANDWTAAEYRAGMIATLTAKTEKAE